MFRPFAFNLPSAGRRRALFALLASAAAAGCARRDPAPHFAYTLLDGSQRDSRQLDGKVVLVNFWATTCTICLHEMPQLAATHARYAARGFETLAVAMRYDPPARVAALAEQRHWPFGVVIDNTGAIAGGFGDVLATPDSVLIDRQGRIAARWLGAPDYAALHARIERLLAEPARSNARA